MPPSSFLVLKERSKIWGRVSSSMPHPVSLTDNRYFPFSMERDSTIFPSGGVKSIELNTISVSYTHLDTLALEIEKYLTSAER